MNVVAYQEGRHALRPHHGMPPKSIPQETVEYINGYEKKIVQRNTNHGGGREGSTSLERQVLRRELAALVADEAPPARLLHRFPKFDDANEKKEQRARGGVKGGKKVAKNEARAKSASQSETAE